MYYLFYGGPQWTSCIIAFGSTFALHFQIANAILSFRQVIAFSGSFANTHSTLRKIRSNQTKLCFVMVLVLAKFINSSLNFLPRLQVIRFVLLFVKLSLIISALLRRSTSFQPTENSKK